MQEDLHSERSIGSAKGVRILERSKMHLIMLLILLALASGVRAKEYIEVWPEGWSEVEPLFTTSIFADRFFVNHDATGINFLSVDGLYFKEVDLTYRLVRDQIIEEEIILKSKSELNSPYLGLGHEGTRYVAWLEKSSLGNSLNYATFGIPYKEHGSLVFRETTNIVQDLVAVQEGKTTHLVWSERDNYYQIKYARIENNELVLLETITDSSDLSVRPSIIVDDQGTLHTAWMETTPLGVEVRYSSKKAEGEWLKPLKVGESSVQDIEQGGSVAITSTVQGIVLAWARLPRNSSRLFVYLAEVNSNAEVSVPVRLAQGSRPRFVTGTSNIQLVWQGDGRFGAQINHGVYEDGQLTDITNLTVGRKAAFRPEVYSRDNFLYVYWLQAQPEGGFRVHTINNEFPKHISLWRRVGIDETAPVIHIFYLFISTLMMAVVYTITNSGVILVGGVIYSLIQRIKVYRKQSLFYQVILIATIFVVVGHLPIPSGSPEFFGLTHYCLSLVLAILGTYLILRKVQQRGVFMNIAMFLIWMVLFQYFALIPQIILQ